MGSMCVCVCVDVAPPPLSSLLNSFELSFSQGPLFSPSLSVSALSLSALSKPPLSCLLALSQLSLELSFSFFTKENIALFLTFYKGKHSPIFDFLQRKT